MKSRPENVRCETCVAWKREEDNVGTCRLSPPSMVGEPPHAAFPKTYDVDWCCEWSDEWPTVEEFDESDQEDDQDFPPLPKFPV